MNPPKKETTVTLLYFKFMTLCPIISVVCHIIAAKQLSDLFFSLPISPTTQSGKGVAEGELEEFSQVHELWVLQA